MNTFFRISLCLILSLQISSAQVEDETPGFDTLRMDVEADTLPAQTKVIDLNAVALSKDSLSAEVEYGARDSLDFDNQAKFVYLYGDAYVNYEDINLTADFIRIDFENNIAYANGLPDSSGTLAGLPHLTEGSQEFDAESITFNFKTKKGIIGEIRTRYNDTYILGSRTKYISKESDTTHTVEDDHINFKGAIFTTCDHPKPHFGIRSSKIKVVPDKLVVVGPSQVEIAGVPTPLILPFGFFPLSKGKRSGLIFPRDYEYSPAWGFGLNNIGWYFPINDYLDATVTGDIYTRGRWGINLLTRYKKRYKYSGSFGLQYSVRKTEATNDFRKNVNKSFKISLRHDQDASAHPYQKIGGSLNLSFNNFDQINRNDAASVLDNTLSSNLNYSRTFPGKPYSLNMGLTHSQNTRTNVITINFPNVDFRVRQITPFKRKAGAIGKERWYEKINVQYNVSARNKFENVDSLFFTKETLDDAQFGIKQNLITNASFRFMKYFNLTPSVNFSETWYWKTTEREFDDTVEVMVIDSIYDLDSNLTYIRDTVYGQRLDPTTVNGFSRFQTMTASLSLNTQIFGTLQFKKGWLKGIRHVIKPTISLNFSPDYLDPGRGYFKTVDSDTRPDFNNPLEYSIYEGGIFGSPPRSGETASLSYSISNIFEAKYFSKKDSVDRKFKLFDNIYINGNYNFAADSLKWSQVSLNGTTRFFKGATTLTFNAVYDPYMLNSLNQRVNTSVKSSSGKLLRFAGGQVRLNTRLTGRAIKEIIYGKDKSKKSQPNLPGADDAFLDLFDAFSINHNFVLRRNVTYDQDTSFIQTNSLSMRGRVKLTKNWTLNVGNIGYDFNSKQLTYPDIGFYRDLHCWEMGMDWQPQRGTYNFFIRVKPGTLDFLKVPYRKNNADAVRGF